ALGREGATLVLDSSESGSDLTIDGEHKGIYRDPIRLPRGPHHLSVTAAGFIPVEREVDLDSGQTNVVRVQLEPTPEKRAAYKSSASFHRTWGWIGILSGAAIAGGGVALAVVGASTKSDGDKALENRNNLVVNNKAPCDHADGYAAEDNQPTGMDQ